MTSVRELGVEKLTNSFLILWELGCINICMYILSIFEYNKGDLKYTARMGQEWLAMKI